MMNAPRWRTISLLLALLGTAQFAACGPEAPLPAEGLAGRWEIELIATQGPARGTRARGVLDLRSDPLPLVQCEGEDDTRPCSTHASGLHTVRTTPLLRHELSREVDAGLVSKNEVLLMMGACCDRGEISARGRWRINGLL